MPLFVLLLYSLKLHVFIFPSLQGLFIFIFPVIRNDKVWNSVNTTTIIISFTSDRFSLCDILFFSVQVCMGHGKEEIRNLQHLQSKQGEYC